MLPLCQGVPAGLPEPYKRKRFMRCKGVAVRCRGMRKGQVLRGVRLKRQD